MDWIEVTARSLEEAKELALDRLGVVEDELEYEVLDEARSGLFGIGRVDARIRARVKPLSREKPADRRRRRKPSERPGRSRSGGRNGAAAARDSGRNGEAANRADVGETEASNGEPVSAATGGAGGGSRRRRGGRGRGQGSGGRPSGRPETTSEDELGAEAEVDTMPVELQAEHAAKFTDELVRVMGFPGSVRTEIEGEDVTVHVEGEGLGPLVGPRGATLHALEEVVRAVVQHHAGGHSAWIHVDVSGYRQRRRDALVAFARKVAAEVEESGSARVLEPMSAADRKVVHDALADMAGVQTGSEGEEPRRRVVIRPA